MNNNTETSAPASGVCRVTFRFGQHVTVDLGNPVDAIAKAIEHCGGVLAPTDVLMIECAASRDELADFGVYQQHVSAALGQLPQAEQDSAGMTDQQVVEGGERMARVLLK